MAALQARCAPHSPGVMLRAAAWPRRTYHDAELTCVSSVLEAGFFFALYTDGRMLKNFDDDYVSSSVCVI